MLQKKYGNSGAVNGLSSSLAFTPIQGIELADPNQARRQTRIYPERTHQQRVCVPPDRWRRRWRLTDCVFIVLLQNKMSMGTGSGTDSVFSEFRGFSKVQRQLKQ